MVNISKHRKVAALIVVVALSGAVYYLFLKPKTGGENPVNYTFGTVQIGAISQSVTGTGQISAARQTDLKSEVAGNVLNVRVNPGQQVKSGTVIAVLDDRSARNLAKDAYEAVDTAKLSLEKLNEPAEELSLIQAQNALKQANESLAESQNNLEKYYQQALSAISAAFIYLPDAVAELRGAVTGSSQYTVQSSSTYLDYYCDNIKSYDSQAVVLESRAASSYQKAQAAYDKNFQNYNAVSRLSGKDQIELLVNETNETSKIIAEALINTTTLIQRYKDVLAARNEAPQSFAAVQMSALSGYVAGVNSRASDLYSAGQNIESAKIAITNGQRIINEKTQSLAKLREGPEALNVREQETLIAQKERALADAQDQLRKYNIAAPFDGLVASININEGDSVSSGAAIATLITDNQIATISLNEIDIAKVEVGQKATLTFSAIDGLTVTGKVAQVGQIGVVSQGVVSYDVTIALDTREPRVKSGMSVAAAIITRMKQNVLLAPVEAVRESDNGFYVMLASSADQAAGKTATEQIVGTGLSDDISMEIIGGLAEGDIVIVSSSSKTAAAARPSGAGNAGNRSIFNIGGGGMGR